MLSEKLITMISGVMTFRNKLSWKSSHPSVPRPNKIASSGGAAATIINDTRRKKAMAIRQPAEKPNAL